VPPAQGDPAARRDPLSRHAWEIAALEAMARGGLAGVAVEPLAARLGATKGSFYWHFANREALIVAALERWERDYTDYVIARVESEPRIEERIRLLFTIVLGSARNELVEVSLLASSQDPLVRPMLERVTERRVAYVASLFETLGFGRAEARRRSLLAYCAFLGHAQLAHTLPEVLARWPAGQGRYLDEVVSLLVAPLPAGERGREPVGKTQRKPVRTPRKPAKKTSAPAKKASARRS
jgi:AcrR family transcriptional regulator